MSRISLARWMHSSLPRAWREMPLSASKDVQDAPLTKLPQSSPVLKFSVPEVPVKELANNLFNQFIKKRPKNKKAGAKQSLSTEAMESAITAPEEATKVSEEAALFDNTKTLVVQATKYLVEASKKNQLPYKISAEEFNAIAIDIVKFVELLAAQAGAQAKKASSEILAFSQQAQANLSQTVSALPESKRPCIFQLTQGALRFMDPHSFFKDSQLYNQSVAKLSEMVARGVSSESSVVTAKIKGLSF